jgi:hypothetical protein
MTLSWLALMPALALAAGPPGGFRALGPDRFTVPPADGLIAHIDGQGIRLSRDGEARWSQEILIEGYARGTALTPWHPDVAQVIGSDVAFPGAGMMAYYTSAPQGVRQNFILHERPQGPGELAIRLRLKGDLRPELIASDELGFHANTVRQFSYAGLRCWDALERPLSAHLVLIGNGLSIVVDDHEAVYPIVIDPVSTTANALLLAPLAASEFGISVCTAGDLNGDGRSDVVVGAWRGSQGQNNEGLAYVYYGSANGIPTTPALVLQVDQVGAQFGCSVSTAGDLNGDGYSDLIIGARTWESNTSTELSEGAVFIYHGSATGISSTFDQRIESNHAGDNFGSNVACAGDINNDGYSDVLIGAYLAEYPTYQEGAVWLHLGSATGLAPAPLHRLERNISGGHFGRSLACAGDVNGDGYSDVIVGAPDAPNVNPDAGAAFVWHGSPTGLGAGPNPSPSLTLYGSTVNNGSFGWSVSTAGDVNGDGYSDVIVGAYLDNQGGQLAEGTARVFHGCPAGINPVAAALLDGSVAGVWFGRSVATAGDVNGDGYADVMVGATLFNAGQAQEGVVRLYLGAPTGIPTTAAVQWELNSAGANLGESINPAGDVNGDGYSDVILGARIYGSGGAAAVFHGGAVGTSTTSSLARFGAATNAVLGTAVANAGDVNGDGYADALFGAPGAFGGAASSGQAYLHCGSATGLSFLPSVTLQNGVAGSAFGSSVASAGDLNGDGYADVVVGAPLDGTGTAYVYMGGPGGLSAVPLQTLTGGSLFGSSVAPAGDVNTDGFGDLLIGAPGSGQAFLFHGSPSGPSNIPSLILSEAPASCLFGGSVNTAGDVNGDGFSDVIVGARLGSNGQLNEGLAFVYLGSTTGIVVPYARRLEADQAGAGFGASVSGAGDINGDGYFDVVVGADQWESTVGEADEGAAFIFNGSASGTQAAITIILQRNLPGSAMGRSVAEAGDVNGDGYADVIIGSPLGANGQPAEGLVYVYRGSPTGLTAAGHDVLENNLAGARSGAAVSGGGDLDGDGYSDVLLGAPLAAPAFIAEGATFWHRGNNALGLGRLTRQYDSDLVTPMSTNGMDFSDPDHFGIGHRARNPVHRCRSRLRYEIIFQGQPFLGNPITTSVASNGFGASWTTLPLNGAEIKELVYKLPGQLRYKWRVREEYDLAKLIDGQRYSRWFYSYANGVGDIGVLPVELVSLDGRPEGEDNLLEWVTASESNSAVFEVQRSTDARLFVPIGSLPAAGLSTATINYRYRDQGPLPGLAYYRLNLVDLDGTSEHSPIVAIQRYTTIVLYPNPVQEDLMVDLTRTQGAQQVLVTDDLGRILLSRPTPIQHPGVVTLHLHNMAAGHYTLQVLGSEGAVLERMPFVKD